jgi:hypothetical protein
MARPLTLLLLAACATGSRFMPLTFAPGDPITGWLKVETPAFTLFTDLPEAQAREAAQEVASELVALRSAFGNPPEKWKAPLRIVVLQRNKDFERYFGRLVAGLTQSDASGQTVYLWGPPSTWAPRNLLSASVGGQSVLRHELAHVQLNRIFGKQPRWFAEGFAQYLETLRWTERGDGIELGSPNTSAMQGYARWRDTGFDEALAWSEVELHHEHEAVTGGLYCYAWALVFELVNERAPQLGAYMAALAQGNVPNAATMFPGEDSKAIDQRVHQFMNTGVFARTTLPVSQQQVAAVLTPATEDERANITARLEAFKSQ